MLLMIETWSLEDVSKMLIVAPYTARQVFAAYDVRRQNGSVFPAVCPSLVRQNEPERIPP